MTQQTINVGSAANDGTGDPLRTGGQKLNSNFTELYSYAIPINTFTATNSPSVQDTTSMALPYVDFRIVIENLVPVTNGTTLRMQVKVGGGFAVANYFNSAGVVTTYYDLMQGTTMSNDTNVGLSGEIRFFNASSASQFQFFYSTVTFWTGAAVSRVDMGGFCNALLGAPITGVKFLMSSGNISRGTFKVYGGI